MRVLRSIKLGAAALGVALFAASAANAATVLYGVSSSNPGTLFSIDPTTGIATSLATLSGSSITGTDKIGLAALTPTATTVYVVDVSATLSGTPQLTFGNIHLDNGNYFPISSLAGLSTQISSLASNGTLFYAVDVANGKLDTITPGGTIANLATLSGASVTNNADIVDLAFNTGVGLGAGTLLGVGSDDNLYTINTVTGVTTAVGSGTGVLGGGEYYGLTYDAVNNQYLLSSGSGAILGGDQLYTIDPSTYAVNAVAGGANLLGSDGSGIDGIAFGSSVPEPATFALAGLALPGLGLWVIKRRKAQIA